MAERFAANLKREREATPWNQEDLAYRAGMHRTRISKFEKGHELPRFETLVKLAGALGISIDALADGIVWEPIVSSGGGMTVADSE